MNCRGCGGPTDPSLLDGLHPTCMAPTEPVLGHLYEMLAAHQGGSARSQQVHLGPSEIGDPCDRKLAYKLFGTPQVRIERLKWAAIVGTWGHTGLGPVFEAENKRLGRERYLIERRVPVAPVLDISGECDCFDVDTGEVIDFKFPGKSSLDTYKRKGPSEVYRTQVHLYGRGWQNAGFEVKSVRILFLPRASHLFSDAHEWSEPYDRSIADAALERLVKLVGAGVDRGLGSSNGDGAGFNEFDIDTSSCRFCPWHQPLVPTANSQGCPGGRPMSPADSAVLDGIVNK
jgi:hypothetical protein